MPHQHVTVPPSICKMLTLLPATQPCLHVLLLFTPQRQHRGELHEVLIDRDVDSRLFLHSMFG
jgi:hypothetical protein